MQHEKIEIVNAAINICECSNIYLWMQQWIFVNAAINNGSAAIENREWSN